MAPLTCLTKDRIAIIGIGCRFPGGVSDTESFWKLLVEGREAVSDVPPDRWNVERFFDAEPGLPGKSIARRGDFWKESINSIRSFSGSRLAKRPTWIRSTGYF